MINKHQSSLDRPSSDPEKPNFFDYALLENFDDTSADADILDVVKNCD